MESGQPGVLIEHILSPLLVLIVAGSVGLWLNTIIKRLDRVEAEQKERAQRYADDREQYARELGELNTLLGEKLEAIRAGAKEMIHAVQVDIARLKEALRRSSRPE